MRPLAFHWHRFLEWTHQVRAARHFAAGRAHHDRAMEHGRSADRIEAAREWNPRLWDRDGDPRADNEDRRP